MKRYARAAVGLGLLALGCWLAGTGEAGARPGGGNTFSGPSDGFSSPRGHGGGGGSSDGAELVFFALRLLFAYPKLGVPVLIAAVVVWGCIQRAGKLENWDTPHHAHGSLRPSARGAPQADGALSDLARLDPDFSRVAFEDFVYRLYASVQGARGDAAALLALAPYLGEEVRAGLLRAGERVSHVVVGALRVQRVRLPRPDAAEDAAVLVDLQYEANLTLTAGGRTSTLYSRELWTLSRAQHVRSKPPGSYERLGCPNCAAPFRSSDSRRCEYCGQVVGDGRFNWMVSARQVLAEESRPPVLTSDVAERGTDRASVLAPDREALWRELTARDPAVSEQALQARIALIYGELNAAWSARELARVRGFLSDGMFDYLRYWVEAYQAQGLQNVLQDMRIIGLERAKLASDRFFDALTVRLFARGIDFTRELSSGKVCSGDTREPRTYSEYWTLIRRAGVRGAPRAEPNCPNCAAPLDVSMAGTCTHCSAHVTGGEFDWVLSKIEQDDVYEG